MLFASFLLAATAATATDRVLARYETHEAKHLVPMLSEVIRFPTYEGQVEAHRQQKAWLMKTAADFGFASRDAGKVTEIELPAAADAPVLGLVIHGDVQPAEASAWSFPPFEGRVEKGFVLGRGAADDKGPLIQALLAMKALKETGVARTHTIRLLVGSEEESAANEMSEYLEDHSAPDYSLVLDADFPVVVGEKAWDGFAVTTKLTEREGVTRPWRVESMKAGFSPSIVPDRAEVTLRWVSGTADWNALIEQLRGERLPEGTRLTFDRDGAVLRVIAHGKSAHSGVNLTGGRNALVALARALEGKLSTGGADDLLHFARTAGQDLHGTGLGITQEDPIWGRYGVNVALLGPVEKDPETYSLFTNLRRIPPRNAAEAKAHLEQVVKRFNARTGSQLVFASDLSYFEDEPLAFDPEAKIVRRLMKVYSHATGEKNPRPAISGGGTYAKRLPNAIAFGMWFPGKPYPGHDVDEKIPIEDLQRGTRVLIHALVDLVTAPRIVAPFER